MGYNTDPIPSAPSASNLSFMNRNITFNNNYVWSQQEAPKVSNMKSILSQCLAVLPIFLMNFSNIIFSSFIAYIPEFVPFDPYLTIYIAGLIVGGVSAQIIGGRLMIMLGALVLIGGWLMFEWVASMTVLLWTVRVVRLTWGMMQSPFYVYLAEVAQPKARGALMATVNLSITIGSSYCTYIMQIVSLTTFGWINLNLIFPIVGFIVMMILPESPHWLANKGRYQCSESALAWFRGWTTPANVKSESTEIINHAQNNSSIFKLLCKNSIYISFLVVAYVFAVKAYSGTEYIRTMFYTKNFSQNNIDTILIIEHIYTCLSIGFFIAVAIISKRSLILMSLFGGSLALFCPAILSLVIHENTSVSHSLLPLCLIVAILVLHFGLGHVSLLLNGELFPSRLRYVGAGIGLFCMHALENGSSSIYTKYVTFPPFTSLTLLVMLGSINFFGFLSLYYLFPENKNKSIVEIEQSCNSIENLRRKH